MIRALVAASLVAACSGGNGPTPSPSDDPAPNDTSWTDTGDSTGSTLAALCAAATTDVLRGTLTTLDGQPLVDLRIKFCSSFGCRINNTDESGGYCYSEVVPEAYSFVPVPDEGSDLAHAYSAFPFAAGELRVLDLAIPPLDAASDLQSAPKEVELGAGLFVTVGITDLAAPDPFLPEAESTAGVQVPTTAWPPLDGIPGTPIAVWYTEPHDYDAPGGLPFRIQDQWSTPEGETRDLWVGSYGDFAWLQVGTLTAQGGWLTGDGVELPLLSTLVLVDPS